MYTYCICTLIISVNNTKVHIFKKGKIIFHIYTFGIYLNQLHFIHVPGIDVTNCQSFKFVTFFYIGTFATIYTNDCNT